VAPKPIKDGTEDPNGDVMHQKEVYEVRPPRIGDEGSSRLLLGQLGYNVTAEDIRDRLSDLARRQTDPVLLAVAAGEVDGLIALHWTPMLHAPAPVARITVLVVRDGARGKGVGRILVDAGATLAKRAGCRVLELTTAVHRTDAHAFYKAIGFSASSLRLHRSLE
jgi:GNAT superfamily N-acetyltransferase